MEIIIYPVLLNRIFTFLDKKSLMNYDSANTNKKNRDVMLYTFKNFCNYRINTCRWTIKRGFKFQTEITTVKYLQYVSDRCTNLMLRGAGTVKIINDNIEKLFIDMYDNKYSLQKINCKKVKNITIIYANYIDSSVISNLCEHCPELKILRFINCNISDPGILNHSKYKIINKELAIYGIIY
jgi:hypothetical protein